jgi:hypothetical protein
MRAMSPEMQAAVVTRITTLGEPRDARAVSS